MVGQEIEIPFKFNFTRQTSKYIDYSSSQEYMETLKNLCMMVKARDNHDDNVDL